MFIISVATCIVRYAKIKPFEIVLDPMAGSGTLPIEASIQYPRCFSIGGDYCNEAIEQSGGNSKYSHTLDGLYSRYFQTNSKESCQKQLLSINEVSVIRWDVTNIPLKDNSIDVIICDMPFGRRSGSFRQNASLYPKFMKEIVRIIHPQGRIILLTLQKKLLRRVLKELPSLKIKEVIPCYMGGLELSLYFIVQE